MIEVQQVAMYVGADGKLFNNREDATKSVLKLSLIEIIGKHVNSKDVDISAIADEIIDIGFTPQDTMQRKRGNPGKKTIIDGVEYASRNEASRKLGISAHAINMMLLRQAGLS